MSGRRERVEPATAPREEEPRRLPRVNEDAEIQSVPGPRNLEEVDTSVGYIDVGSIFFPAVRGIQMRTQIADDSTSVLRALLVLGDSRLQILATMAPRSGGV